jgi:hypothetical protein
VPQDDEPSEPQPLRFSNETKLRRQMIKRGWTEQMIREALATDGIPTIGKREPALRHVHPTSGKSVIIDRTTGEIFHVGGEGYLYE